MPDETPADRRHERPDTGPLRELTLGRSTPSPSPLPPSQPTPEDDGLESLAARCRLKAGAARWAAERQRRIHEQSGSPDEDAPSDPATAGWAEALTDAFYWASADDPSGTPDVSLLDHVGGCFETVAEGLLLVRDVEHRRGGLERALPLLAEAQSALRQSLRRLKAREDPDQVEAYERVRDAAARRHLFLKRFLRADDPADPAGWPGLLARIEAEAGSGPRSQRQARLLDRLRSFCAPIGGEPTDVAWRAIFNVVEELIGEGAPPSSREVRELLLPLLDDLPEAEEVPPGSRLVLREIDRYLATRHTPAASATSQGPSASVREAARLLSGRSVVLIGGLRRPEAQRALKSALGLKELVWIGTKEHQPISAFEPAIARPDVALVLLAIRWSSHAFGDVKPYCDRHGKPLVRLPGGYGANQVAAQILSQSSEQLGDR
ncbi:MAG: hypothetical protein P4L85_00055 [Paludisphaera borealis]|uniref:hypothetical protein n=1 Tax=Paludisphaera borealis TaxID=1387353 RepID=UPI00284C2CD0|nr:hypothetical protein [Paludisphaera borealis]MDR3617716.1 hypothetical protein [Paludisphaera borealis]